MRLQYLYFIYCRVVPLPPDDKGGTQPNLFDGAISNTAESQLKGILDISYCNFSNLFPSDYPEVAEGTIVPVGTALTSDLEALFLTWTIFQNQTDSQLIYVKVSSFIFFMYSLLVDITTIDKYAIALSSGT